MNLLAANCNTEHSE